MLSVHPVHHTYALEVDQSAMGRRSLDRSDHAERETLESVSLLQDFICMPISRSDKQRFYSVYLGHAHARAHDKSVCALDFQLFRRYLVSVLTV